MNAYVVFLSIVWKITGIKSFNSFILLSFTFNSSIFMLLFKLFDCNNFILLDNSLFISFNF